MKTLMQGNCDYCGGPIRFWAKSKADVKRMIQGHWICHKRTCAKAFGEDIDKDIKPLLEALR